MFAVGVAVTLVAVFAAAVYLMRERLGFAGAGLAALRTVGLGALILLFINPARSVRVTGGPPVVLLDASLSMVATGGHWLRALDTARTLAGANGTILRFAADVEPFDTLPLDAAVTHLTQALTAARARGGPTIVVTDGEIADAGTLPPTLLLGTKIVLVPRDTVPDAALLDVRIPRHIQREDSVRVTVTVGTWGALGEMAMLEASVGERRILRQQLALPPAPGTARRRVTLPPGVLEVGDHVLRFRLVAPGDAEPRNDERVRIVSVIEQPAIVIIVDPPDWEGRFLVRELSDIAQRAVRGYARTAERSWVEMRTLRPASDENVRAVATAAGLLVLRGEREQALAAGRRGPVWRWPAGADLEAEFFAGDWYVTPETRPSPLAGRIAAIEWDSVPPLTGVVPLTPGPSEWIAVSARQGRRGAARPVLVGTDSGGWRQLTTAGAGLWRWSFRGGAAREAYRTVLASGVDWLLASATLARSAQLAASLVVARGEPVAFRWRGGGGAGGGGDTIPDSIVVTIAGARATRAITLRFDAAGIATAALDPGVYRWSAPMAGARGVIAVEQYSPEFHPGAVATLTSDADGAFALLEQYARERWWLFFVAIAALAGEWAWRQQRGLP